MVRSTELREKEELLRARKQESAELSVELANTGPRRKRGRRRQAAQRGIRGRVATGPGWAMGSRVGGPKGAPGRGGKLKKKR
jgi:hypothetical protein